jgi:excinuclease UvrABC nuclease subunit
LKAETTVPLSEPFAFATVKWSRVPAEPGVYVIADQDEIVYVGMAGRNGKGSVRNRLRDHASGQIVNMFAQYLFLARVQFLGTDRITHPRDAKAACRAYIAQRCTFQYKTTSSAAEAKALENRLKEELRPALNP